MAYILQHYFIGGLPVLIPSVGLIFLLYFNANSTQRLVKFTKLTLFVIIVLEFFDVCEDYCSTLDHYNYARVVFSFFGYILRPVIPCLVIGILVPDKKRYLFVWIPAAVNLLVFQFSLYTDWVFWFNDLNEYNSTWLKYTQPAICGLYGAALLAMSLYKINTKHMKEGIVIVFSISICAVAGVLELFDTEFEDAINLHTDGFLNIGYIATLYLYFIFTHLNSSKRDTATSLFNRETYYNDTAKFKTRLSAIIALDMNGLKKLNDTEGHEAGDLGLWTISRTIEMCCKTNMFAYRVGGDEFIILCVSTSIDIVQDVIAQFRKEIAKTRYTCSIGYAYAYPDTTIEEMKRVADIAMYNDKNKYYESLKQK